MNEHTIGPRNEEWRSAVAETPPPPVMFDFDYCGGFANNELIQPLADASGPAENGPPIIYVEFAVIVPSEFLKQPFESREEITEKLLSSNFAELRRFLIAQGLVRADLSFQSTVELLPERARFYTLHFRPGSDVEATAQKLNNRPEVTRAIAGRRLVPPTGHDPLNEPLLGKPLTTPTPGINNLEHQWYVYRCGIDRVWKRSLSGKGVVIADIDWGFRTTHFDLRDQIKLKYNSMDQSDNVSSSIAACHGSAVLGHAGAANNGYGMVGVAFGSQLWAIMAGNNPNATFDIQPWLDGLEFVIGQGSSGAPKVVMLEVQTLQGENIEVIPQISEAINYAVKKGIVVCVAAGNGSLDAGTDANGNSITPTDSILVGATGYHSDENPLTGFSNYGPSVAIYAPGDRLHDLTCGALSDNAYRNGFGGTSGATPKVAGTIALMLEANPGLKQLEIKDILRRTGSAVTTVPSKPATAFLNAEAAICEALKLA